MHLYFIIGRNYLSVNVKMLNESINNKLRVDARCRPDKSPAPLICANLLNVITKMHLYFIIGLLLVVR